MIFIFVLLVVIALCSCTTTNGDMAERMVAYDSITISIDYPYISDYTIFIQNRELSMGI